MAAAAASMLFRLFRCLLPCWCWYCRRYFLRCFFWLFHYWYADSWCLRYWCHFSAYAMIDWCFHCHFATVYAIADVFLLCHCWLFFCQLIAITHCFITLRWCSILSRYFHWYHIAAVDAIMPPADILRCLCREQAAAFAIIAALRWCRHAARRWCLPPRALRDMFTLICFRIDAARHYAAWLITYIYDIAATPLCLLLIWLRERCCRRAAPCAMLIIITRYASELPSPPFEVFRCWYATLIIAAAWFSFHASFSIALPPFSPDASSSLFSYDFRCLTLIDAYAADFLRRHYAFAADTDCHTLIIRHFLPCFSPPADIDAWLFSPLFFIWYYVYSAAISPAAADVFAPIFAELVSLIYSLRYFSYAIAW